MEPRVEAFEVKLVGVQGIIRLDREFVADLERLHDRLWAKLDEIANVSDSKRTVGYWHIIDAQTAVYFAGIEVDTFVDFSWDYEYGLAPWDLGQTTWAIWKEKDGEEGAITHGGVCWRWLAGSEYEYDHRFIGDFEVHYWEAFGEKRASEYHEIWIPIVEKRGTRGKN